MTTLILPQNDDPAYRVAVSDYALTHKIPYGDPFWPKFNASFNNLHVSSMDLMNLVYRGQSFTTWHKNHWREGKNYECGQHLAVDFDTEDERSTLGTLTKDSFVKRYAAFVYTTISHTPEKPRGRVVFLLDTPIMQAKNYTLAASALLWLFGTADRQCKDAARFFYGAKGCEIEILDNVLPVATIRELIAKYQETGRREKRRYTRTETPTELRDVEDALRCIDPWRIDYGDWVRVLMALHAEFGDMALPLAEQWGDGEPGEVEKKWRSFHPNGNAEGRVTIATVFAIAKQAGWQYQKAA